MIIRKPYAFLIKYFKTIHISIFFFILYLLFTTRNIYIFFRNYLQSGTYTYIENMAITYVSPVMIIVAILLIAIFLLIYFLMKQKEKKVFYYLMGIIFYFISFVFFLIFLGAFNNLEYSSYSNQTLVLYRDFAMVIYYFNYFFMVIAFIRGFGFNIKKFNFEKDLKELDITEEDREEIEVGSSIDFENVGNFVRRRKRNFMYYIKENSYILVVFLVIIILLITFSITLNRLVISKVYKENETISTDSIDYTIVGSYLTNKDLYGNIIKKSKEYLVVAFEIVNKTNETVKLSMENTRIKVGQEYFYPKSTLSSNFEDLGIVYKKQSILKNSKENYILVFELNEDVSHITLELYRGKKEVNGEAILYYREVSLNPYSFKEQEIGNYQIGEEISLKDTYYKEGSFSISSLELLDIDNYAYSECDQDENCVELKGIVVPKGVKKLLKIKYGDKTPTNLFSYLNLEGSVYETSETINNVTPLNYEENTVLFEVPGNTNIDNIILFFNIRGSKIRVSS